MGLGLGPPGFQARVRLHIPPPTPVLCCQVALTSPVFVCVVCFRNFYFLDIFSLRPLYFCNLGFICFEAPLCRDGSHECSSACAGVGGVSVGAVPFRLCHNSCSSAWLWLDLQAASLEALRPGHLSSHFPGSVLSLLPHW